MTGSRNDSVQGQLRANVSNTPTVPVVVLCDAQYIVGMNYLFHAHSVICHLTGDTERSSNTCKLCTTVLYHTIAITKRALTVHYVVFNDL